MQTVFLHVGPHKTGTKSVQCLLSRLGSSGSHHVHRDLIDPDRGICTENAWRLAHAGLRPGLQTPKRQQPGPEGALAVPSPDYLAEVTRSLRQVRHGMIVVSSEAFSFYRQPEEFDRLRRVFGGPGRTIVPVIVRRDPAEWRRSWAAQLRRAAYVPPADADASCCSEWYFDFAALMGGYATLGSVCLVDYDSAVAEEGSVLPAIAAAMRLPPVPGQERIFVNRTADAETCP